MRALDPVDEADFLASERGHVDDVTYTSDVVRGSLVSNHVVGLTQSEFATTD